MIGMPGQPVAGWSATVRQMTARDVASLAHMALAAVCIEVLLRVVPLRTLARLFGVAVGEPKAICSVAPSLTDAERRRVHWARVVARRWPLGEGPCLRRSLLIGHGIRRLHPMLRIGVARTGGDIGAHAWLEVPGDANLRRSSHVAFDL